MGENSIGKTAIGKVTSFNPITKDGLIVVKKTKENVVIQDRANKKDPLIFTLLENDEQIFASALDPYFQPEGIAVIEWFNRWTGPRPADFRHVTLQQTGEQERLIRYEDLGT